MNAGPVELIVGENASESTVGRLAMKFDRLPTSENQSVIGYLLPSVDAFAKTRRCWKQSTQSGFENLFPSTSVCR